MSIAKKAPEVVGRKPQTRMHPDASQKDDMEDMFKNLETMLARMR